MKKIYLAILIAVLLLCACAISCKDTASVPNDTTLAEDTSDQAPENVSIKIAETGKASDFKIIYSTKDDVSGKYALRLAKGRFKKVQPPWRKGYFGKIR